jgi:tRNA G18 (ribose-2'-O)-methylase SpoU
VESLNAAVAASVLLYEAARQRAARGVKMSRGGTR